MNACGSPAGRLLHPPFILGREAGPLPSRPWEWGGSVWTSVLPVGGKVRLHRTPGTEGETARGWVREGGGELGRGAGPGLEGWRAAAEETGRAGHFLGYLALAAAEGGAGRGLSGGGRGVSEGPAETGRKGRG